ncbi:hypothetical protein DWB77_07259 [Streptomyces hundungensis]|uniref:Uncharacterized protein n=1 Tax=Streptomyces hundungensis TaxID=1077946 RepID=A0A387HQK6_9ACTN|nr:hypothetical protein DWB77_07259 [Streptomyces hundungensis]
MHVMARQDPVPGRPVHGLARMDNSRVYDESARHELAATCPGFAQKRLTGRPLESG